MIGVRSRHVATAVFLLLGAPIGAQERAAPAHCNCARDKDANRRWWLWLGEALAGGYVVARMRAVPLDSGYVDTGLDERAPTNLATSLAPNASGSRVPLAPRSMRVFTANALACPVEAPEAPAPRSRRAIDREKAWWRALSPAARDSIDRVNVRREKREREQRKLLCLVLIPAAVPAGIGLKMVIAAGSSL